MNQTKPTRILPLLGALLAGLLAGCASPRGTSPAPSAVPGAGPTTASAPTSTSDDASFEESLYDDADVAPRVPVNDPLEGLNRAIFGFNDAAYRYLLSPLAKGYAAVMPDPAEQGISNFFRNLGMPVRSVSSLLQGKPERAGGELRNFLVDSTLGIAGLGRPSAELFEPLPAEDLGQTFGTWGLGNGPYLVLPILGPTTVRDGVGMVGEWFLDPIDYVKDYEARLAFRLTDVVNELPGLTERYEALRGAALDPYVAMRDAYLQFRQQAVAE